MLLYDNYRIIVSYRIIDNYDIFRVIIVGLQLLSLNLAILMNTGEITYDMNNKVVATVKRLITVSLTKLRSRNEPDSDLLKYSKVQLMLLFQQMKQKRVLLQINKEPELIRMKQLTY